LNFCSRLCALMIRPASLVHALMSLGSSSISSA
jgi:hypothetical protein